MLKWLPLNLPEQIAEIAERSKDRPCIIFKHSTSCGVSSYVQYQLEEDWHFSDDEVAPYLLDVIAHRQIAKLVAEKFEVHHESPQLLLIRDGDCTYDASHLDISVSELRECFHDAF